MKQSGINKAKLKASGVCSCLDEDSHVFLLAVRACGGHVQLPRGDPTPEWRRLHRCQSVYTLTWQQGWQLYLKTEQCLISILHWSQEPGWANSLPVLEGWRGVLLHLIKNLNYLCIVCSVCLFGLLESCDRDQGGVVVSLTPELFTSSLPSAICLSLPLI